MCSRRYRQRFSEIMFTGWLCFMNRFLVWIVSFIQDNGLAHESLVKMPKRVCFFLSLEAMSFGNPPFRHKPNTWAKNNFMVEGCASRCEI